ncbi:MAG: hypothetical protein V3R68_00365 [Gammaproteobacteria bacterium]
MNIFVLDNSGYRHDLYSPATVKPVPSASSTVPERGRTGVSSAL